AVSNDPKNPLVVSASEDGTVRIWGGPPRRPLWHPAPVRAVACTPVGAAENLCLTGAADGKARLWDLSAEQDQPIRELGGKTGGHRGPINCVAFSPDGKTCATGGDDREINVWDVATGNPRYRLPGHKGAITSLQFTPLNQLVSASR